MIIKNINIFTEEKKFVPGTIITEGEMIRDVVYGSGDASCGKDAEGWDVIDGGGCYAIPGMIDLHFHGGNGFDFCDGSQKALDAIARYEASIGVTAICPATMTLPIPDLCAILRCAAKYRESQISGKAKGGARLVGINMEGPFISRKKKGAQDERYILPCDAGIFREFQSAADGLVRFIGIAPEEGNACKFIEEVKDSATVSLAHTDADYETAKAAICSGAKHAVHLYNAMTGFDHRNPGVAGAVFDSGDVTAELICDGIHVHPAVVRATFRVLGAERLVLISDSMRATGLPDGDYTLGGLDVVVRGKRAVLKKDGALAGSVTSLPDCLRCCVKEMDIPLETAVACATMNPARCLGLYEERGSLVKGKAADIVLLERDLRLKRVILNGKPLT